MITLGLDAHPASHTVVALVRNGLSLGSITVPNDPEGLDQLHQFASQFANRRWAIEVPSNAFIGRFISELLARREAVHPIAPSLTINTGAGVGKRGMRRWTPQRWRALYWQTHSCRTRSWTVTASCMALGAKDFISKPGRFGGVMSALHLACTHVRR